LLKTFFLGGGDGKKHQGYPVVDGNGRLLGVVTRTNLLEDWIASAVDGEKNPNRPAIDSIIVYDLLHKEPITIFPEESCRRAAELMAQAGVGRLPVVSPEDRGKVIGMITRSDLLRPRARQVDEEMRRERLLTAS
jgi:CBS domain-containing protein